jgi:hypothetical protein
MRIIVPTRGRIGKQTTLEYMSPVLHASVTVVCPAQEINEHIHSNYFMEKLVYMAQPDPDMTIAAKRAWILENHHQFTDDGKLMMMDDDLRSYIRREDRDDRLRYSTWEDQEKWIPALASKVSEEIPHAGFGPRQGNDRQNADDWVSPARMMLILAYHAPTVVRECVLGRIETREDMDYSLQLLRKGFPNAVHHRFVVGQAGYNAKGGASLERTLERSNSDAQLLADLHPGYVRVVEKTYKNNPRLEVMCYWQRALRDGKQWRLSQAGGGEADTGPSSDPATT